MFLGSILERIWETFERIFLPKWSQKNQYASDAHRFADAFRQVAPKGSPETIWTSFGTIRAPFWHVLGRHLSVFSNYFGRASTQDEAARKQNIHSYCESRAFQNGCF